VTRRARTPTGVLVRDPAHAVGLGETGEVPVAQLGRTPLQRSVRRAAALFGLLQPLAHLGDPFRFLGTGQPGRDEDDDFAVLAVGRDRAATTPAAAYLDERFLRPHTGKLPWLAPR